MSQWPYRVVLIVPAVDPQDPRLRRIREFVRENIDTAADLWFRPCLAPRSDLPATHAIASFSCDDEQVKRWINFFHEATHEISPPSLDNSGPEEKIALLSNCRSKVQQELGSYLFINCNLKPLPSLNQYLEAANLTFSETLWNQEIQRGETMD